MNHRALDEADDQLRPIDIAYLSYSRLSRYLHCPEQYRLYYVETLRPRIPAANLVFGQLVHGALAQYFKSQANPAEFFAEAWQVLKHTELKYSARDSWTRLEAVGTQLLAMFLQEEAPKISNVMAIEQEFSLDVTSLELPLVGIIDLNAVVNNELTVVDFKTSASSFETHESALSDQLTGYRLAVPEAEKLALCVLVKTKEPRIEWHPTTRNALETADFLAKAQYVGQEIAAGHFYKRPGKWCSWCDFLPVCVRDEKAIQETLIKA